MRPGNKSTKRRNNEANFKNQSTLLKPINFESLKNRQIITKEYPINIEKPMKPMRPVFG